MLKRKEWIIPLCLGQLLSLCITGTSSASSALWQHYELNIPFTQNCCMYFLLTVIYGSCHWFFSNKHCYKEINTESPDQQKQSIFNKTNSHFYVLAFSLFDVQANVLAVTAFKNTSVLSALIISSWTLPCIMLLSYHLLNTRYRGVHIFGVSLCLVGLILLIWSDTVNSSSSSNHSWIGDLFCLVSSTLYAISNVSEEYLVHHFSTTNFLYQVGFWGMVQSGLLAFFFEYDILISTKWSWSIVLLIAIYVLCLFCMYSLIPKLYRLAGATFVSMNLMTSNFYSLLMGLLFLNAKMPPFYPLAYLLVIIGASFYNSTQPPVYHHQQQQQLLQSDINRHEYETLP
ncbi:unnamed protein product [Cunninghamella echinulata]